jgi:hypothetical protein
MRELSIERQMLEYHQDEKQHALKYYGTDGERLPGIERDICQCKERIAELEREAAFHW